MKQKYIFSISFFIFAALSIFFLQSAFGQTAPVVTPSLDDSGTTTPGISSITDQEAVLKVRFTSTDCTAASAKVEYATSAYYDGHSQQYNQSTVELAITNFSQTWYPHVSSLTASTAYAYRIAVKCTAPTETAYAYTSNATFTTNSLAQAPDAPTIVNITSSSASPYVLTVIWKQSTQYVLASTQYYFSYTAGTAYSKNIAHDTTVATGSERTATLDYNLESGKTYTIQLTACNGTYCSSAVTKQVTVGPTFTVGADGLVSHWKFDGNGTNEVAGGPSAATTGNATFRSDGGKLGGYLYIPASGDSARIPYHRLFDLPTSFTIEFWFRQRAERGFFQDLVYKGNPINNYNFRVFRQLWNQYNFGPIITGFTSSNTGYWTQTSNSNQLAHNEWHHVAFTKDAAGSAYYLDGTLIHASGQTDPARTPAVDIVIGGSAVDTDIDNLRIYNRSLNLDEVLSNGGFPARQRVCTPDTKQCSGNVLQRCSIDGYSLDLAEYCAYGCDTTTLACSAPPITPTTIELLLFEGSTKNSVTLKWTVPANPGARYEIKHKLKISPSDGSDWDTTNWTIDTTNLVPGNVSMPPQNFTIAGLQPNTEYLFGIRAYSDQTSTHPSRITLSSTRTLGDSITNTTTNTNTTTTNTTSNTTNATNTVTTNTTNTATTTTTTPVVNNPASSQSTTTSTTTTNTSQTPTSTITPTTTNTTSTPAPTSSDTNQLVCSTIIEEVCGEYRGQLVTYGNSCEMKRSGATYRSQGKCSVAIADPDRDYTLRRTQGLLDTLRNHMTNLSRIVETLTTPQEREVVRALLTNAETNYGQLKTTLISQDVSQMKSLGSQVEESIREGEKKITGVKQAYTKDFIREEAERNRALSQQYTINVAEQKDLGIFGDDPTYLRAKIEKKQAVLKRAEEVLARGDKKLAERLFTEAEDLLDKRIYVYTTPTNATSAETSELTSLLEEVRNGLTAVREGVDRLKKEGITSDPALVTTLEKAETIFEGVNKAIVSGDKEEALQLFGTLKQLGLHEKFSNFRTGTGRSALPKERVTILLNEIKAKRDHLDRGSEELVRRGGDTSALEPLRARLTTLITKAESAYANGDEKFLAQLLDELRSMDIESTLSQIFRNLGEKDFATEIREPLANASEYVAAMKKVIDELRERKTDVAFYEKLLDATEAARVRGQIALDANDTKGAGEAVHTMFASSMKLYELLGAQNVNRYLSKKERAVVTQSFEVSPADLANVTVLGDKAEKTISQLVTKTANGAADRLVMTETLSQMPADVVAKLIAADKQQKTAVQSLMASMVDLPSEVRSAMFEKKIELLDELTSFTEARRAASRVKGVTRAALEQIDALKVKLADFNFPPETASFIIKRVETFTDTLRGGTLTDPQELTAYVETFQKEMAAFFAKASEEKYASGIIPAKNIDDRSALYGSAMTLKEEGAIGVLLTNKGEVQLASTIDGKTYEQLLEAVADENIIKGTEAQRLKNAKTVRGSDAVRYLALAYKVTVPRTTLNSPARLANFAAREFGATLTQAQLARPLTRAQVIALVGGAEDTRALANEGE